MDRGLSDLQNWEGWQPTPTKVKPQRKHTQPPKQPDAFKGAPAVVLDVLLDEALSVKPHPLTDKTAAELALMLQKRNEQAAVHRLSILCFKRETAGCALLKDRHKIQQGTYLRSLAEILKNYKNNRQVETVLYSPEITSKARIQPVLQQLERFVTLMSHEAVYVQQYFRQRSNDASEYKKLKQLIEYDRAFLQDTLHFRNFPRLLLQALHPQRRRSSRHSKILLY